MSSEKAIGTMEGIDITNDPSGYRKVDNCMEVLHSRKAIVCLCAIGTALILLLCLFLSWSETRIYRIDVSELTKLEEGVTVAIDNNTYIKDYYGDESIAINGWCIVNGRKTAPVALHVLLRDAKRDEYYEVPTTIVSRPDVTELINDGTNYDNSGFSVSLKNCSLHRSRYEIFIRYRSGDDDYLIPTSKKIRRKDEETA